MNLGTACVRSMSRNLAGEAKLCARKYGVQYADCQEKVQNPGNILIFQANR